MTHRLHAKLHLLSRQLTHHDSERMLGKVDDVELDLNPEAPVVVALLSSTRLWADRLPGWIGRVVRSLQSVGRSSGSTEPLSHPISHVQAVDSAIRVDVPAGEASDEFDSWFATHLIAKIPGADHETE